MPALTPVTPLPSTQAAALPGSNLLALQTVLSVLGFDDPQADLQQASVTEREQTAPLLAALQAYARQPDDLELAKPLLPLLQEAIEQSEAEYQHLRQLQAQYIHQASMATLSATSSSYWQRGRDWLVGNLQWLLGTTARDQAEYYAEIAEKRHQQITTLQQLHTELQEQITADEQEIEQIEETTVLHAPQRRLLQASTPVTVINPIPDQVIEATVEYSYDLSEVFTGDYTQIEVRQANGSEMPSWLSFEPKYLGGYDTPGSAYLHVQVMGTVAYVADGNSGLQILNMSSPANVTRLGGYDTPGTAYGVQVVGTLAYVADWGSGLQILNVSNPGKVTYLGGYDTPGYARGVQVVGTMVYVADDAFGLQILNVSNPTNVTRLGGYDTPGNAYSVQVVGTLAYLTDWFSGLQILNVSNPMNVTRLGGYDTPGGASDVQVVGAVAYVADYDFGLQILNVNNPVNVTRLGGYDTPGLVDTIQIVGAVAYVADWTSGLQILDVSNSANVIRLGGYDTPGSVYSVQVIGAVAYVADWTSGLQVVDLRQGRLVGTATLARVSESYALAVSAWSSIQWQASDIFQLTVARLPWRVDTSLTSQSVFPSHPLILSWDSDILFTDVTGGVLRLSVALTNLTTAALPPMVLVLRPTLVDSYDTPGLAYGLQVVGTLAYVTDNNFGLQILDISNPAAVTRMGGYDTPGGAHDVQVVGALAYVADYTSGLQVLNVSNPMNVTRLGNYDTSGLVNAVQVVGALAYVADGGSGLQILNVSNPANVTRLGGYDTPGDASDVQIIGGLAYVADDLSGLQILNVSNPANVTRLGGYDTPSFAYDVQVVGTVAYVADIFGLQILNVSNPANVTHLSGYDTPGNPYAVQVIGTLTYVADDTSGLQIFNVSNPTKVTRLGGYDTPGSARDVEVVGILAYVADDTSGLQILDLTQWEFTVNPTAAEVGNYQVTLTATNSLGGSASDSFLLRVEGPPQIKGVIPQQFAKVGQVFNYFIPQGLFTDPNLDVISYEARLVNQSSLPDWLVFNGISATFTGTPQSRDVGNYSVTLSATDNIAGSINTVFALYVDHQPVLHRLIPRQVAGIGSNFRYRVLNDTLVDPDHDILLYNATRSDGSALPAWLSFDPLLQEFSGSPVAFDNGSYALALIAQDPYQGKARAEMALIVEHAPQTQQSIIAPVAGVGQPYQFTVPAQTFSDADDSVLIYSATRSNGGMLPNWLNFQSASFLFSGVPSILDRGVLSLRLQASDSLGLLAYQDFNLTITSFPVVAQSIEDQIIAIDEPYTFTVPATSFIEPDGEPLDYQLQPQAGSRLPAWLQFNASTRTLSGFVNESSRIRYDWSLFARDPFGATAHSDFTILAQHRPLQINPLAPPTAGAGQSYQWTIPPSAFIDPDGDHLQYQLTGINNSALPSWLRFDGESHTLSGSPDASMLGDTDLMLQVSDTVLSISAPLTLSVRFIPELVTPIPPVPVLCSGRSFNITLNLTNTFRDLDDPTLLYQVFKDNDSPLPSWLSFNSTNGVLSGTPGDVQVGALPLTLIARDSEGHQGRAEFRLLVEPNYSPELNKPINNQVAQVGQPFEVVLPEDTFMDRNEDTLRYQARSAGQNSLPDWLKFNSSQLRFFGTPQRGDTNSLSDRDWDIVFSASDDQHESRTEFQLTVKGTSQLELFLKFGLPFISIAGALLAIYRRRAMCLNRCKPQRYQKLDQHIPLGGEFKYTIDTPAEQVKAIRVQMLNTSKSGCCRFFRKSQADSRSAPKPLPGGFALPHWMQYDPEQNRVYGDVPASVADNTLVLQVLGDHGVLLEQSNLNFADPDPGQSHSVQMAV